MIENRCGAALSDSDAEARYGPGWRSVLEVVRQAERLTPAQIKRAAKLRVEFDGDMWAAASRAAQAAAKAAGRTPEWAATAAVVADLAGTAAAWAAAWDDGWADDTAGSAGWRSAWIGWRSAGWCAAAAATAAVVADLVGTAGLTAEHIATLAAPWREITNTEGERDD